MIASYKLIKEERIDNIFSSKTYEVRHTGGCQCYKDCDCYLNKDKLLSIETKYYHNLKPKSYSSLEACKQAYNQKLQSILQSITSDKPSNWLEKAKERQIKR